jgi:hypothetical protein
MPKLKVAATQRNLESLLKLLGGTPEERLRFWEIVKGITTPAQFNAATKQLAKMEAQVAQTRDLAKSLKSVASKMNG